jgi:hypothetical protein
VLGALALAGVAVALALGLAGRAHGLKGRSQAFARARLAGDEAGMRRLTDPADAPHLGPWLAANPPPDAAAFANQNHPSVSIAVERDDDRTADVALHIEAKNSGGPPLYFALYQRWVEKDGTWCFSPTIDHRPKKANGTGQEKRRPRR